METRSLLRLPTYLLQEGVRTADTRVVPAIVDPALALRTMPAGSQMDRRVHATSRHYEKLLPACQTSLKARSTVA